MVYTVYVHLRAHNFGPIYRPAVSETALLHGHYVNSFCYLGTGHVRNTRGNYCFGVVGILAFQNIIFAKIILILAGIVVAMLYKIRNSP